MKRRKGAFVFLTLAWPRTHTHTLACAHLFEPGSRQQHPTHPDLHLSLAFEREKKNYHSPKISKLSKEHVNGTGEINKRHNDYRM